MVASIWPFVEEYVSATVHAAAEAQLAALKQQAASFGVSSMRLSHFSLGPPPVASAHTQTLVACAAQAKTLVPVPVPPSPHDRSPDAATPPLPQVSGIRSGPTEPGADSVVLDVEIRIAGADPIVLLCVELVTGQTLMLQLAALQVTARLRLKLASLCATPPFFGAVCVSFMEQPFVDFQLGPLQGDVMAIPGLDSLVRSEARKALATMIWPSRLVVPVLSSEESLSASLQAWPTGVVMARAPSCPAAPGEAMRLSDASLPTRTQVRLLRARHLPRVDVGFGACIDPFFVLHVTGGDTEAVSLRRFNTQQPSYRQLFALSVVDPQTQTLVLQLFDSNSKLEGGDMQVGIATLPLADVVPPSVGVSGDTPALRLLFRGWLPLHSSKARDALLLISLACPI